MSTLGLVQMMNKTDNVEDWGKSQWQYVFLYQARASHMQTHRNKFWIASFIFVHSNTLNTSLN